MKNTAKSLIAVLLTLVMLLSSVVLFGVSGSAESEVAKKELTVQNNAGIRFDNYGSSSSIKATAVNFEVGTHDDDPTFPRSKSYIGGVFSNYATAGATEQLAIAFTVKPGTKAIAGHYLNMKTNTSVKVIEFMNDGSVKVLGKTIPALTLQKDVAVDFHLATSVKWASGSSTNDGWITIAVYINGVYATSAYQVISTTETAGTLYFGCSASQDIAAEDGRDLVANYFTRGYSFNNADTTSPAGIWATMKYTGLTVYAANSMPTSKVVALSSERGTQSLAGTYVDTTYKNKGVKGAEIGFLLGANTAINMNANISGFYTAAVGTTSAFDLSFRLTPTTEAIADHYMVLANKQIFAVKADGSVKILGSTVPNLKMTKDVPVDFKLQITAQWPSVEGTSDGKLTVEAYANGVHVGAYSLALSSAANTYNVVFLRANSNDHVTEANGQYMEANALARGYSSGSNNYTSAAGYYALCRYDNVSVSTAGLRDAFIYSGASMRLRENAATSGLRFTYGVDKAWFDSLEGAKVGALIIPTDKLAGGFSVEALAELTKGTDYIDIYADGFCETAEEADASTYVYYASLVNIREKNYTRSFTGVGFVELADGTRIYTASQSRSIYEVAKNATISSNYEGTPNEARIDEYLSKVVSLGDDFSVEAIKNYERDIVGAASGEGFTLTGTGVDKIKTIIIGGVSYTGGWTVEGGVLTVAKYVAE